MNEIWKDIPGFENKYWVSNLGNVRSFTKKSKDALLKLTQTEHNYLTVNLTDMNCISKYRKFYVHVLVWWAFNGKIPNGYDVDHINKIRNDNSLSNLRLLTIAENRSKKGELHRGCKINRDIVLNIRNEKNKNQREIATQYGLDYKHVNMIIKRKIWSWL